MTADTLKRLADFCRQTADDGVLPSLAWFAETADELQGLAALVRAGGVPQPETEQFVIEQVTAHWFTQGGQTQFGELSECHNADEVVSAILSVVRRRLDRDLLTANDMLGILKSVRAGGVETPPALDLEMVNCVLSASNASHTVVQRETGELMAVRDLMGALKASLDSVQRAGVETPAQEPLNYKVFAEELTEVIWWMLGERDDLPPLPSDFPRRKYWWRNELRQRFDDAQIKAEAARSTPPPERPQEP